MVEEVLVFRCHHNWRILNLHSFSILFYLLDVVIHGISFHRIDNIEQILLLRKPILIKIGKEFDDVIFYLSLLPNCLGINFFVPGNLVYPQDIT